MRRVFQVSGLSGLLLTGLLSSQSFAQESANPQPSNDDPKVGQAAPVAAAAEVETPAAVAAPAAVKPKVGDLTTSGYFRGGFGASNKKGRMTCFGLTTITGGLKSKYRLGNECEQWGEFHFNTVVYSGDDGVVGRFHFMPAAYLPTTYSGYSPTSTTAIPDTGQTSTGAAVSFPNLYADVQGIPWLFSGKAWAGSRYYKREDVYISDFFYWNPSGVGTGVEDFNLGKAFGFESDMVKDLSVSLAVFAVDGQPSGTPPQPPLPDRIDLGFRPDFQIRGFRPWTGGELQLGIQGIVDWSDHLDANGKSVTHGGYGFTMRWVQDVLGGTNKVVLQYGKGGGTGFGTLSRFYYPDFSLMWATTESRIRALDVLTIQPTPWLGAQVVGVYQRDDDGLGQTDSVMEWFSTGGRVSLGVLDHLKLLGEVGYDKEQKSNGAPPLWLIKSTGAVAFTTARSFMARPEVRLFFTYARWSEAAGRATVDSGRLYTDAPYNNMLTGIIFGTQAEAMW